MNSHKRRKLKRHPLVRFIRGIFRLLRVLFRPTKSNRRQDLVAADSLAKLNNSAADTFDRDEFITVGELLDRVKWQSPLVDIQPNISSSNDTRTRNISRN